MNRFAKSIASITLAVLAGLVTPVLHGQVLSSPVNGANSSNSATESNLPPPVPPSDTVALIGYAGPLSNAYAPSVRFARSLANAIQLAIDAANQQKPRINGKEITFQLLTQDDRSDVRMAALVAQYLVKRNVVGVIGHGQTSTSMAAAPIYHQAGIALLSPTSSGRAYTEQGLNTSFRVIGHTVRGAEYLSQYVASATPLKRVAVLDNGTAAGHGFAEQFARAARENHLTIVNQASVSEKTSDFNKVLGDIKQEKVDAVFWGGLIGQAVILTQSMRRLHIAVPLITGANSTVGSNFLEHAGAASYGVIALENGQPRDKLKGWQKFQHDYTQRFDDYIDPYALQAYDAAQVLMAAVRQANSLDPVKITSALHSIRFNGITGPIAFNDEGDLLSPVFSIYRLGARDWEWVQTIGGSR